MSINIYNQTRSYTKEEEKTFSADVAKALSTLLSSSFIDKRIYAASAEVCVDIRLVGSAAIRKLNAEHRSLDKVTDVLSFPVLDMVDGQLSSDLMPYDFSYDEGKKSLMLGDVVICPERAKKQAEEYGHSLEREMVFLAVHSFLHLLGFDHEHGRDEDKMFSIQEEVLVKIGLPRDPDAAKIKTEKGGVAVSSKSKAEEPDEDLHPVGEMLPHCGYCALIGRPNVGKSTLLNAISGMKLAIVSHKPQTTRTNISAIYNREDAQVIFVDTPGIHRPESKLSEFMVDSSFRAAKGADVVVLMVDGRFSKPANVEKKAVETAKKLKKPLLLVVNKADAVSKESLLPLIANYSAMADFEEIIPISALKEDGIEELMNVIISKLPSQPRYFPMEEVTDQSEREISAELIREQILHFTNEEIPHGTAVEIDSFEEELKDDAVDSYDRSLIKIHASIICEKDSHKSILLGKNGQMIKRIGTAARQNIEKMTDCKVFLDLYVKVRKDWKNKQVFLNEFGYTKKDD
ncbi:MAG: GTPase Era [Clostridiales bacterium]|nr:GTPase Era [Clostridiales bacterium]